MVPSEPDVLAKRHDAGLYPRDISEHKLNS